MPRQLVRGARGFLLVEAVLATLVIAVGLVFISRGISGSLNALSMLRQRTLLLRLAESTLTELKTEAQQIPTASPREGDFGEPNSGYRWALTIRPLQGSPADVSAEAFRAVSLTVSRIDQPTALIRLHALWPLEWVAE